MHSAVGAGSLLAGRYRLDRPIGRGAMGVVWRGRDELLERDIAVKEVRLPAAVTPADADVVHQRTLREAKTAARLNHPGVVTVFDVFEEDGSPWIVMEFVRARALDQVVTEDGPLPPLAAARVGECLLSALSAAHSAGVLHRDVKPSNVLLGQDGRAVLTDFGIATFAGDPALTQVGMVVGSPGFTAPERLRGQPATPASDLWSLGATLYAAVEGRGPFERTGGAAAIMAGVVSENAPRAPSAGPLMPVIDALLRANPAARPDTATAARLLAEAAASAATGGTLPAYPWPYGAVADGAGSPGPGITAGLEGMGALQGLADPTATPGLADQAADGGTTAAFPVPPGSSTADGIPALMAAAAVAAGQAAAGQAAAGQAAAGQAAAGQAAAGQALAPGLADRPGYPGFPGLEGLAGATRFADFGNPADAEGRPGSADLPAFLDLPAFPDMPRFSDPHPFPLGLPDPPGQQGPAAPGRPAALGRPRGHGRALAAALAATAVLAAGLLGLLAYAHSGGQTVAQGNTGLRLGTNDKAAGTGRRTAGGTGAAAPASPSPGRTGAAAIGAARTTGASPATTASPAPGSTAGSPPAGYRWYTVSAAGSGTAAGFTIAVPGTWQASTKGLITQVSSPAGNARLEINLTSFAFANPVREARSQQLHAIVHGTFPGYRGLGITAGVFRAAPDAAWHFSWRQGIGRTSADDLLVSLTTTAGEQSYALSVAAPRLNWFAAYGVYLEMLRTFQPEP